MADGIVTPQTAPSEVFGIFAGQIDQQAVQRLANALTIAINGGVQHVHLLFQSNGGLIGDGVCLYNLFRSLPILLTLYNVGSIASVGVVAYLGAKQRKSSGNATFMIHKAYASPQMATSDRLQAVAQGIVLDDERVEAILRSHIILSDDNWATHKVADLWISAKEAQTAQLVTEVGDFAPPKGCTLFYVGQT